MRTTRSRHARDDHRRVGAHRPQQTCSVTAASTPPSGVDSDRTALGAMDVGSRVAPDCPQPTFRTPLPMANSRTARWHRGGTFGFHFMAPIVRIEVQNCQPSPFRIFLHLEFPCRKVVLAHGACPLPQSRPPLARLGLLTYAMRKIAGIRSPTRCDAQASRSSHPRPAESAPK